jgi:hypothetical protein
MLAPGLEKKAGCFKLRSAPSLGQFRNLAGLTSPARSSSSLTRASRRSSTTGSIGCGGRGTGAAIEAGKHVFMEKPVAVEPVGVRSVIANSELAEKKGLAIVAGTERRHQQFYLELMKRVQDGQIGEIVGAECYWNQADLWVKQREPNMTEMETPLL